MATDIVSRRDILHGHTNNVQNASGKFFKFFVHIISLKYYVVHRVVKFIKNDIFH